MNKEWVHLIASGIWGTYGLTVGTLAVVHNDLNVYTMVTLVTAIVGNSAHLISMSLSKTGNLTVASKQG